MPLKDPEKRREYNKKYKQGNKERANALRRKSYPENKERINAHNKKYRESYNDHG